MSSKSFKFFLVGVTLLVIMVLVGSDIKIPGSHMAASVIDAITNTAPIEPTPILIEPVSGEPTATSTEVALLGTAPAKPASPALTGIAKAITTSTRQLLDKDIFGENEQSSAIIHSRFSDGSTNIIFYIDYGNNNFQYNAETSGYGDLPLSDYYAPAPGIGKYIAVEYFNDGGAFGCSGISLSDCIADPHFVSQFRFEVTADQASVLAAITATTTLATAATATTTSIKETEIIPSLIDGILDFFGIPTATTTATSVEMPPADAPITAATIATTTPEITAAISLEETIPPPQDAVIPPPEATPAPIIQASSPLAAAVGLLGVKISNGLAAIMIIGILFLAFTLSGQNKKTK